MSLLSGCPRSAALSSIPIEDCLESIGQIQKIVIQRMRKADGARNKFVEATANPNVLGSWTPLLSASDDTKVVQTPFLSSPETEAGAARKYGGGNATLGGIEIVIGREPTTFTSMILRTKQATIKALKEIMTEDVGIYFIDEHGRVIMDSDGASPVVELYPIQIRGQFVGDKKIGGLEEPDSNAFEFSLLPNWSDNLRLITPTDFDALNDLKTP